MSDFSDALDALVKRVRQAAEDATTEGARRIAVQAQRNATGPPGPDVWTGRLHENIKSDPAIPEGEDSFTANVYVGDDAFYGTVQEHGDIITGDMVIRTGDGRPRDPGHNVYSGVFIIYPRPFFYRSFDEAEADVQAAYEDDYTVAFEA